MDRPRAKEFAWVRIGWVLCEVRRRTLEGGGQRRSIGCVAEAENRPQGQKLEGHEHAYEKGGQKRKPGGLIGTVGVVVRDEKRHESDEDRCDRNPVPSPSLAENAHRGGSIARAGNREQGLGTRDWGLEPSLLARDFESFLMKRESVEAEGFDGR